MSNVNITEVHLLNVPLENDYKHTLYFSNITSQQTYFESKKIKSYTDFSYQRKDNIIRVGAQYDSLLGCNYVMYKNAAYSNKWFYAFITDMQYVDDGRTDVSIETDVLQTWMFDYQVKASFVEREHSNTDVVGDNLLPENVELGDYISYNEQFIDLSRMCYVVVTDLTSRGGTFQLTNNIVNGYDMLIFGNHSSTSEVYVTAIEWLRAILGEWSSDQLASIFDIYCVPWESIKNDVTWSLNESCYRVSNASGVTAAIKEIYTDLSVEEGFYKAKNNKLYTYPYVYLEGSNLKGQTIQYKVENFKDKSVAQFKLVGNVVGTGDTMLYPLDYSGDENNYNQGLSHGGYIHSGWGVDGYNLYVAQNSSRLIADTTQSMVSSFIPTGEKQLSGVQIAANQLFAVQNAVATLQDAQHSLDVNKGSISSGTLPLSMGINGFRFRKMGIKPYYARIIDNYFSMFGYKTNLVKVPNKNHRVNYWYTKCIDVNIDGPIPTKDMQRIKDCYNNGITFWKNPAVIQDYTVDNSIV